MTLEIALPPDLAGRLQEAADREGVPMDAYALRLLEKHLPQRFVDPRSRNDYVLLSTAEYERLRELAVEERQQQAIHDIARRNAGGRMHESS